MKINEVLILNLEEVRRRSIKIRRRIPDDKLEWKPDAEAMSCIETARHVLKSEWAYMQTLRAGKSEDTENSPFYPRELTDVSTELKIAEPIEKSFSRSSNLTHRKNYRTEKLTVRMSAMSELPAILF